MVYWIDGELNTISEKALTTYLEKAIIALL
jgi:hypothetical protein